jgi:hypothetical protein
MLHRSPRVFGKATGLWTPPLAAEVAFGEGLTPERVLLRFVDGRPISALTTQFLEWCCERLEARSKRALLLACFLPVRNPWRNTVEPKWAHSKQQTVEPERLVSAQELADHVCHAPTCSHEPHLPMPNKVA